MINNYYKVTARHKKSSFIIYNQIITFTDILNNDTRTFTLLASGSTALSYQQMYEGEYIHMVFEAVRNRDWIIACNHAQDLLVLLGEDEIKIPQLGLDSKNTNELMTAYATLYVKLSRLIATRVKTNLDAIRKMYRDKEYSIPKVKSHPPGSVTA